MLTNQLTLVPELAVPEYVDGSWFDKLTNQLTPVPELAVTEYIDGSWFVR